MRLCPIASGSSGNCIYVGSDTTHVLIDAGISGKRIIEGLNGLDLTPADISGLFVTHEHSDHIMSVGMMVRKFGLPLYTTKGTAEAILRSPSGKNIDPELINIVRVDEKILVGDLFITPFRISHDAAEPVAYCLESEGRKASVATDLGVYDDYTVEHLKGSNVVLAEANHDVRMLETGPYPYYLKTRILSDRGHLSNESAGRLLSDIACDRLQTIILGHLSTENNLPELAYETVRLEIESGDNEYHANDFEMIVAKRSEPTRIVEI